MTLQTCCPAITDTEIDEMWNLFLGATSQTGYIQGDERPEPFEWTEDDLTAFMGEPDDYDVGDLISGRA